MRLVEMNASVGFEMKMVWKNRSIHDVRKR
jgi:hypothetical protein